MTARSHSPLLSGARVALATVALSMVTSTVPAGAAHATSGTVGPVVRSEAAHAEARWSANAFATSWMRHANERHWTWIRKNSRMATRPIGPGVRLSEIRYWLDSGANPRLARCSDGYDDDATTKDCWTADAANILVKRTSSGRLLVTAFWIED